MTDPSNSSTPGSSAADDVQVRPAEPEDHPWILDLIAATRHEDASPEERARTGFVQGHWTPESLAHLEPTGPGYLVAQVESERAGFALSSGPGAAERGPAAEVGRLAAARFGADGYYLYGPVVVDPGYQGRGLLRRLMERQLADASARYPQAIAFVELANTRSVEVHQHLGWVEFDRFTLGEREYVALHHPTS